MTLLRPMAGHWLRAAALAGFCLLLASNLWWWVRATGLRADVHEATAENRLLAVERGAWQRKTAELAGANLASQRIVAALQSELAKAQSAARRLEAEGQAAIAAARAAAEASDRELAEFGARYARQLVVPACAAALGAVQQRCPQFEGY